MRGFRPSGDCVYKMGDGFAPCYPYWLESSFWEAKEIWLVFYSGNLLFEWDVFVSNLADGSFLSGMVGVERSVVECVETREVLGWVRHIVSKIGDVAFSEFTFGGNIVCCRSRA